MGAGPFRHCSWNSPGADGTFLSGEQSDLHGWFRVSGQQKLPGCLKPQLRSPGMSLPQGQPSFKGEGIDPPSHRPQASLNPPASAGDSEDVGSIPGSGRSPGGEHGKPLQYSCLEDPMDRGAQWATSCRVAKSKTRLKGLTTHVHRPSVWKKSLLIVFVDNLPQST